MGQDTKPLIYFYLDKEKKTNCIEIDEHSSKLALCTVETADCLKGLLTLWQYRLWSFKFTDTKYNIKGFFYTCLQNTFF